jgi:hypothetical protein
MSIAIKRFIANKMKDIQSGISLKRFTHIIIVTISFFFLSLQMFIILQVVYKDRKVR